MINYKRKRIHSTKTTNADEDGPIIRRPRISMPSQRQLTIDTSPTINNDKDSAPRGIFLEGEDI